MRKSAPQALPLHPAAQRAVSSFACAVFVTGPRRAERRGQGPAPQSGGARARVSHSRPARARPGREGRLSIPSAVGHTTTHTLGARSVGEVSEGTLARRHPLQRSTRASR